MTVAPSSFRRFRSASDLPRVPAWLLARSFEFEGTKLNGHKDKGISGNFGTTHTEVRLY